MTIASLTAATPAPTTAPKGAASSVQSAPVAPDAPITTEAPVLSNLETAVAAARQSAAAQQDGLAMLMANLLRATAAGNLPTPVQQAVDQLLALHLPTDVAPDAAAVKNALQTSGLFTEANLASNRVPADVKTSLLQLNTAAEDWLASAPSLSAAPSPASARPQQTVPVAAPVAREPNRRSSPRGNEAPGAKPAVPAASAPQRSAPAKNQMPTESDAAPEAETIKSAIRLLGQVTQTLKASGAPELPKEIKAALVLVRNAITSSTAAPASPMAAPEAPATKTATPIASATPALQRAPSPEQHPTTSAAPIVKAAALPQAAQEMPRVVPMPGYALRGSSPVEQLLALQLAPTPPADVLPTPVAAPAGASSQDTPLEAVPASDAVRTTPPPAPEQPDTAPAKPNGTTAAPTPATPSPPLPSTRSSTAPSSAVPSTATPSSPVPSSAAPTPATPSSPVPSAAVPTPATPSSTMPSAAPSPSVTPEAAPSLSNDVKTLLTLFAGAVEALLPRATRDAPRPSDVPSQQTNSPPPNAVPQQPAPVDITAAVATLSNAGLLTLPSAGVPNDLKTLLSLFNLVAGDWLPHGTSAAGASGPTGTPSVPPPVHGVPSKAQPAALATLPENADPVATAKQLLSGSDAALARNTLLQIASLPDATPQARDARWVFDLPLMTPQGAAVAQMIIERDGSGTSAEKPTPVWRAQFAIDIEPLGPVRANLALSGDRAWVTISADRPESLDKLQSGVSWLADALQSSELEADIAFQTGLPPQRSGAASRFMDHAS